MWWARRVLHCCGFSHWHWVPRGSAPVAGKSRAPGESCDLLVAVMMFAVALQLIMASCIYSKRLWNLYSTQLLRGYAAPPVL